MLLTRRHFLAATSAAAAGLALPGSLRAEGFSALRGGLGIHTGRGGTLGWLVSDDAVVVVDSQYPASAEAFLAGLRERSSRKIDALINTHHHQDHVSGNGVFRPQSETIVAHARVPGLQKAAAREAGTEDEQAYADTTYEEDWRLDLPIGKVVLRHYGAAHTGGDSVIHFEWADAVHVGDLVFNRWYPRIDRPGGASIRGWIDTLETLIDRHGEKTTFIFGHANPAFSVTGTRADLSHQRDYLAALLEWTRKGIAAGRSAQEIGAADVLPGFESYESPGASLSLAANVEMAYEEFTED